MSDNKATDLRPPFFLIEEAIIDNYNLQPLAGWLYVVIVRHINRKRNDAFPSVARLAKLAHMSKRSVIRYTKVLEDRGLIRVTREKDSDGENLANHYQLLTATVVVSDSHYPSDEQALPVVPDRHTNQKKINQKKENTLSAPPPEATPRLKRAPNEWYDAINAVWGFTASYNGEMQKMLQGTATRKGFQEYNLAPGLTPEDILAWGRWYRVTELHGDPALNMLADRMKIQSSITAWREKQRRKSEDDARRALADQEWQDAHPELYNNPLRRDVVVNTAAQQ